MFIKKLKISNLSILALFFAGALMIGCDGNSGDVEDQIEDSVNVDNDMNDDFNKAKQVFYSLPSPIETAMLMKRAGAKYNQDYLNPLENLGNYTTTRSMALNLGVYSADLSFASMFDQSQASIKYLSATKKLADDLGILNAIDKSIIERMEQNINNRDSLMEIISETFMNSNSFLKENDRAEVAAIILIGGWVEGLYIATQIAKNTSSNKEIIDRIVDQRLSLSTLLSLMNEYKSDPNVAALLPEMEKIKAIFDKIEISSSKIEAVTTGDKTTLQTKTEIKITPEVFDELCKTVEEFRNSIIK